MKYRVSQLDLSKLYPPLTKIRMRISQLNKYLIDMELILLKALRVLLLGSTKQLQNIPLAIKGECLISYWKIIEIKCWVKLL